MIRISDNSNTLHDISDIHCKQNVGGKIRSSDGMILLAKDGSFLLCRSEDIFRDITAVYIGRKLIWEAAKACFSRNMWRNDKPWSNSECWN